MGLAAKSPFSFIRESFAEAGWAANVMDPVNQLAPGRTDPSVRSARAVVKPYRYIDSPSRFLIFRGVKATPHGVREGAKPPAGRGKGTMTTGARLAVELRAGGGCPRRRIAIE